MMSQELYLIHSKLLYHQKLIVKGTLALVAVLISAVLICISFASVVVRLA
jgi:hypothetical protein